MLRDTLILAFIKHYPDLFDQMQSTSQSNTAIPSPYHAEDSVWTHTFGVMSYIQLQTIPDQDKLILLYAALLHDTGKVSTATYNPKHSRNSFHGHEGVSAYLSLDILPTLIQATSLSADIPTVFRIIALHGQYIESSDISHLLSIFRLADKFGAVRDVVKDIQDQYPEPKYCTSTTGSKHCTILCGLPNSGKTTHTTHTQYDYIVSRDQCIEDLYVQIHGTTASYNDMYIDIVAPYKDELNNLFQSRLREARNYSNICIDMTMMSRNSRRTMMYSLPGFSFSCILFLRPLSQCKIHRPHKIITDSVFQSMMTSFTLPQLQEGFTSVRIIDAKS